MFITDKTNSTLFLYPILKLTEEDEAKMGFINSFLEDPNRIYPDNGTTRLFVLFKPCKNALDYFQKKVEEFDSQGLLEDEYDYPNGHVVLVFKLPSKYNNDYRIFKESKFSKYSDEFKKLFPDKKITYKNTVKHESYSLQFHVFNKTPGIRKFMEEKTGVSFDSFDKDMEFWNICDMEIETLKIENYIKNEN